MKNLNFIFQLYLSSILTIALNSCCPDRVEPTLRCSLSKKIVNVGDTVDFIDQSSAAYLIMNIYVDSISIHSDNVYFQKDFSFGRLGYNDTLTDKVKWIYPLIDGWYTYDTSNRFKTRFVINQKVKKLIVAMYGENYYRVCYNGYPVADSVPIPNTFRDTIYVQ